MTSESKAGSESQAAKRRNRDRKNARFSAPDTATAQQLAVGDVLLELIGTPEADTATRDSLRVLVVKRLLRAYGAKVEASIPAPVPSGSTLHAQLLSLRRQADAKQHECHAEKARQALIAAAAPFDGDKENQDADAAAAAAPVPTAALTGPLSVPKQRALCIKPGERFIDWIERVNKRVPSTYLVKQGRAAPAAKGALQEKKQGVGVLKPVLTGTGNKTRTSEHASATVAIKTKASLSDDKAVKTVRVQPRLSITRSIASSLPPCACR